MPERKIQYEPLSPQKDVGFLLSAPSYERLFIDAALALTDFRFRLELIETSERIQIEVKGKNLTDLMAEWLSAVFHMSKDNHFIPRRIVFEKFDGTSLKASLHGEKHSALKHGGNDTVVDLIKEKVVLGEVAYPEPAFTVQVRMKSI